MHRRLTLRRSLSSATAAALGLTGLLATAPIASAQPQLVSVPQTALAYTDSAAPATSYSQPTGDLPLGSSVDAQGTTHTSRVYTSFDLTGLAAKDSGKHVVTANLVFGETSSAVQTQRSVEVWQTSTPAAPVSWRQAPEEKRLLGTVVTTAAGPAYYLHLDLTSAAERVAASGSHTLSIELRLPQADEKNPALGRTLARGGASLYASSNTPPAAPTKLYSEAQPCSTTSPGPYLGTPTPPLTAMLSDADPGDQYLTGHFAIWPAGHGDQRTEFTSDNMLSGYARSATVPAGLLSDGGTYAWQVRGGDGTDLSAWSKPCYFHVDTTLPATAPTVTSSNYPADRTSPGGVPAEFTLGSGGVRDVTGYQYSWTQDLGVIGWSTGPDGTPQWTDPYTRPGYVRADQLGGTAKLSLVPPDDGPSTLWVRSLDRAFNPSPPTAYRFFVANTMPQVTGLPASPRLGAPFTLQLAPNASIPTVDSYTVQVNNDAPQTVPAAADGTALFPLTLTTRYGYWIKVRSHSPNGWVSSANQLFTSADTRPTVTSDVYPEDTGTPVNAGGVGVTGVFTFAPKVDNVVSYTYSFDWNDQVTVPAGADGTAKVSWAPDAGGQHTLSVTATDKDGVTWDEYDYYFDVN